MLKAKQKVKFKTDYKGYFKDYIDKTFTVKLSYTNSMGTNNLMLKELKATHLLDANLFEVVK
jgi:hypothetical protein